MDLISYLYSEILWRPLFNGLIWLYNIFWQDIGLALILLVIIVRLVLAPLLIKAQKSQKDLAKIQPDIKKIQESFKDDKEKQSKALMELYSSKKINPFSGCLIMLFYIPVFIALFHVFQGVFKPESLIFLYSFVSNPISVNPNSFGILDLSKTNIYLGVLAAITQYIQTKMTGTVSPFTSDKKDFSSMMQWQAVYIFPFLILVWSYTFPSILVFYWTILNLFGIVQEFIVKKFWPSKSGGGILPMG